MVWPRIGINKDLNDRDHPQQRQRREARGQSEEQEDRPRKFVEHCKARGEFGRKDGHFVFVFKQLHCKFE